MATSWKPKQTQSVYSSADLAPPTQKPTPKHQQEKEKRNVATVKLKREIGKWGARFLVLNCVIGAGIYGLPGALLNLAGDFSPWLFLIFGILVISIVLTFAALASYFSTTGGPILYTSTAFGPLAGFQMGWLLYMARAASFAANLHVLFDYGSYLWAGASVELIRNGLIFLVIGALITINILGIKKAIQAINILAFFKTIPLIVMIILGFKYLTPQALMPADFPQIDDASALVLLILYAFIGFESSLISAGETKNPRKAMPSALISMMLFIAVFYFLIQLAYVSVAPAGNEGAPLVEMGEIMLGTTGAIIIVLAAIFSVTGNVTSSIISCSRISFIMAQDGSLPKWFGVLHPKYNTPVNSLVFLGILVFLLAISGSFIYLAVASTLTRMLCYAVCVFALPIVRRKADETIRREAMTLPGGFIIPGIALLLSVFAMSQASMNSWLYLFGFTLVGNLFYFVNARFNK